MPEVNKPFVPVIGPQFPVKMVSRAHPAALQQYELSLIRNGRFRDRTLTARPRISNMSPTGLPSTTNCFRGSFFWNGTIYAGYVNGAWGGQNAIGLYKSTDAISWSQQTVTSGASQGLSSGVNGSTGSDNRLPDNGRVLGFLPIKQYWPNSSGVIAEVERLAVSSGDSTGNYSCDPVITGGTRDAIHRIVKGQDQINVSPRARAILPAYWNMSNIDTPNVPSTSDSGGGLSCNLNSGLDDGKRYFTLNADGTQVTNDYAIINCSSIGFGSLTDWVMRQCVLVLRMEDPYILQNLKIEIDQASGSYKTVYDPRTNTGDALLMQIGDLEDNFYLLVLTSDSGYWDQPGLFGLKFTWKAQDSTDVLSMDIMAVAYGGNWPGLSEYRVTLVNDDALCESIPTAYRVGSEIELADIAGAADVQLTIPELESIYYTPVLPIAIPAASEIARGVNRAFIYIRRPGEAEFSIVLGNGCPTYSSWSAGSWTISGSTHWETAPAAGKISNYRLDNNTGISRLMVCPDEFVIPAPPFRDAILSGSRGVLAAKKDVYVSENQFQLRHRESPNINSEAQFARTATKHSYPNDELYGVMQVEQSNLSSSSAYAFGKDHVYILDLYDARIPSTKIMSPGVVGRGAYCGYRGSLFVLNTDRQVQQFVNGTIEDVTRGMVDNYIQMPGYNNLGTFLEGVASSDSTAIQMSVFDNTLHVAFAPCNSSTGAASGSNTKQLICDFTTGVFGIDDGPAGWNIAQYMRWDVGSGSDVKLLAFGSAGTITRMYSPNPSTRLSGSVDQWLDMPSSGFSNGTPIQLEFVAPWYNNSLWGPVRSERAGLYMMGGSAANGTLTLYSSASDLPPTSTESFNTTTAGNKQLYSVIAGARGVGTWFGYLQPTYAGWKLFSAVIESSVEAGKGAGVNGG